jgi:hypothetical protein
MNEHDESLGFQQNQMRVLTTTMWAIETLRDSASQSPH